MADKPQIVPVSSFSKEELIDLMRWPVQFAGKTGDEVPLGEEGFREIEPHV